MDTARPGKRDACGPSPTPGVGWRSIHLHEPAHCHLMQLYAGTNQHAAALRQYAECARILDEELGVPPSAETVQLYQAIKV